MLQMDAGPLERERVVPMITLVASWRTKEKLSEKSTETSNFLVAKPDLQL